MAEFCASYYVLPEDDRIAVIELSGSLDITTVDKMTGIFNEVLATGKNYVIAQMEGVGFISSPSVGALMGCKRRLVEKQGNLVLVGLSQELRHKLNLMGANRIFQYYSELRSVLTDFNWEYDKQIQKMRLKVPSNTDYVPAIRRLVSSVVQHKGYSRKDAFRIETIVDELSNNAIEHGEHGQEYFEIDFTLDKEKVEFAVRNRSEVRSQQDLEGMHNKFNNPVIDDESIRGRGLALVKMLSSEMNLTVDEDGTLVHVKKIREE
jgi:anti-anti-sigma factor